ncbi:hypothetical protein J2Z44_002333 [Clostridium punense]|uniref:DUF3846 domain-containing protein n=1 Tax=Clostridium punense TaxID=1054297 RepID=A0ABS4K3Z4_9CLOT|nr:DUF3846 domain-containing protein [Clostridium sp. BL8]EQB86594.1 hypothetical protein M918_13390 [Clostridium sp. BL8]MBP2022512.1 hypothetical protein [Clostridium punense]
MRILIIEPQKVPYEAEIIKDLASMQKIVEGLIQAVDLDENTSLVCNEEGKLIGLEGNRRVGRDIIAGTFFLCGFNEEGEFTSLNDEQIKKYSERFKEPEQYGFYDVKEVETIEVMPWDEEEFEL